MKKHEYLFPASPHVRFKKDVDKFQKPHARDIGKRLRRIRDLAGINELRIHDLCHNLQDDRAPLRRVWKVKHFSPEFKKQTTELIAGKLLEELEGTNWGRGAENEKTVENDGSETTDSKEINGGADGLEPAIPNVTGQNSVFQIWLNYKQNNGL